MSVELRQHEMELFNRYKAGDELAKRDLLKSMAPVINGQVNKFSSSGLPQTAIKLEGQKLTMQAFETYDPTRSQLNTHVTNYLKKLTRFVGNYQNVGHIPEPRVLIIGKYKTIFDNMKEEQGREPNSFELADAMKVSVAEIERLQLELRSDLSTSIISDDEDDTGTFYKYVSQDGMDPKLKEAVDFVYFDADAKDKKILEGTLGIYGSQIKLAKDLSLSLGMSDAELKRRKEALAKEIKDLMQ